MGSDWDSPTPSRDFWKEVLRVLKPGGYRLSFFGARTYHRGVVAIEDAGFIIRDQIAHIQAQGFPKGLDISKQIDKMAGVEREIVGNKKDPRYKYNRKSGFAASSNNNSLTSDGEDHPASKITAPKTEDAKKWDGWNTALKPAFEPICVAMKPLDGNFAENVLKHSTGAFNIDGCRVPIKSEDDRSDYEYNMRGNERSLKDVGEVMDDQKNWGFKKRESLPEVAPKGRHPSNIIFDNEAGRVLDEQSGGGKFTNHIRNNKEKSRFFSLDEVKTSGYSDSGGASRFFNNCDYSDIDFDSFIFCKKSHKTEKELGLDGLELKSGGSLSGSKSGHTNNNHIPTKVRNTHPTVKPIESMRHLTRLVTPPGGVVLDPFMGSGTTGIASYLEGFDFIGMELNEEYFNIAEKRIEYAKNNS